MSHLREYQSESVGAAFFEWQDKQSTLIVLPTGTGKTVVAAEIIKRFQPKRTLFLAHREELIFQGAKTIQKYTNLNCEIEMADLWASPNLWNGFPVIVSTIQTQIAGKNGCERMTRFEPDEFGLVVVDEAHRVTAKSYRKVLAHYKKNPELKILCLTATPDRADEEALGQMIESVAYDYEILDAINDGYLVPIEQQMVTIEGLDFSQVRTTAGDLNGADLAAVMEAEKNLHGIAAATLDIIGERRTLVFTAGVKQAEMLCEIFNRHKPNMAGWVYGGTPKPERRELLTRFADGRTQVVVNCNCLSEGFDNPGVEVVIQARPTKSRSLYAQQCGRSTRPLAGVVDGLSTAEERKAAISASAKPSALIVDFVGNAGRHKLMTTADILGGKVSDEAIQRAIAAAAREGKPVRMDEELNKAERDIQREIEEHKRREAARKAHLVAKARFSTREVNPFDLFQIRPAKERGWDKGRVVSEKMANIIRRMGVDPHSIPYSQARQLCGEQIRRWEHKLCTVKQAACLAKHGYDTKDMSFAEANKLMDILARNNWRRPAEHGSKGFGTGVNQFGA